jgi:hypothetical protein
MVQRRQNGVACFTFGDRADLIVWIASYQGAPASADWRLAPSRPAWSEDVSEALGIPQPEFYYKRLAWVPGALNEEFAVAARGGVGPLAVHSLSAVEVICPYDGGMDLILADASRVSLARTTFRDWLSPLPSGL